MGNTHRGGLHGVSIQVPLNIVAYVAKIDNDNGSSLTGKVLCPTLQHVLFSANIGPNSFSNVINSIRLLGSIRVVSRGPVNGSSHSGPIACVGTCSRVQQLFTSRPCTRRAKLKTSTFSFGVTNKHYRRYRNRKIVGISVRFVTSIRLIYRTYKNGHFHSRVLRIGCHNGSVCSILRVAMSSTVTFFNRRGGSSAYGQVIRQLGPLRSIKLNCVGLNRSSSALSNNRDRHIGLTSFLAGSDTRNNIVFVFSRPAAKLRFRSVGGLLTTFGTLVRQKRAVIVIRRGVSIVGYTS